MVVDWPGRPVTGLYRSIDWYFPTQVRAAVPDTLAHRLSER